MPKKDLTPNEATAELYARYFNEEYISFLTLKIVQLSKKRLTRINVRKIDQALQKEFDSQLKPSGALARVLRRVRST
jgi:hypothetical protein